MQNEDNVIKTEYADRLTPPPADSESYDVEIALRIISQWQRILNARLLALLALAGALAGFGYCIYEPTPPRIWSATLYAAGVLWPVLALFFKKGK